MSEPAPAPPRVALIGVSGYARVHLQLLREWHDRGWAAIAAATVINPEQESATVQELQARGARVYRSYEEMMRHEAGAVDLCLIPTGIQWHARMTIAALRAGMNVLVEKPLAGSLDDVRAIRDAEAATGRFVAVGFQDMYAPATAWLKTQLVGGRIGRLRSVRVVGFWPRGSLYYERNQWAGRLTADGAAVRDSPFNNAFAHFVHLALFFAGPDLRRSARVTVRDAELLRAREIESFDTAVVRADSPEGVAFWFGLTHACQDQRDPVLRLEGSEGAVEWHHLRHCSITTPDGRTEQHALTESITTRRAMMSAVMARLRDPAVFIADTAMAEAHAALIEQLHMQHVVRPLPASMVATVRLPERGDVPVVPGLEQAFDAAFAAGGRLRDVGFIPENLFSP